jgi:hypothetical protein
MEKHEAEALITTIRGFVNGAPPKPTADVQSAIRRLAEQGAREEPATLRIDDSTMEKIYRAIYQRLIDQLRIDPVFLQLVAARPEIELLIEPQRLELNGSSMKGRCAKLIAAGWFATGRKTYAVRMELARTGADPGGGGGLAKYLAELRAEGFLTRSGEEWQAAPGIKITERTIER